MRSNVRTNYYYHVCFCMNRHIYCYRYIQYSAFILLRVPLHGILLSHMLLTLILADYSSIRQRQTTNNLYAMYIYVKRRGKKKIFGALGASQFSTNYDVQRNKKCSANCQYYGVHQTVNNIHITHTYVFYLCA